MPQTAMLPHAGATIVAPGVWRAEDGDVRVICPMTIGGSFDATTTALSGLIWRAENGSGAWAGSLVVNLRTLDTGMGLRNEHLRTHHLEVGRGQGYDQATLSEIDLKGLDPDAPGGRGFFSGSLMLHGMTNTVTGPVDVRRTGAGLRVNASFRINLSDHHIPEPRHLGVGVRNTVHVQVAFAVTRGASRSHLASKGKGSGFSVQGSGFGAQGGAERIP